MASLTRWMWVWVNSEDWWWTAKPGVVRFMGSQRVGHDWATERNWTELNGTRALKSFPFHCFPLFLCIDHWGRLSYLSLLFFGTLHSDAFHGVAKSQTRLSNWTELNWKHLFNIKNKFSVVSWRGFLTLQIVFSTIWFLHKVSKHNWELVIFISIISLFLDLIH